MLIPLSFSDLLAEKDWKRTRKTNKHLREKKKKQENVAKKEARKYK